MAYDYEIEEKIRNSFLKIKQDMQEMKQEIQTIKQEITEIKDILNPAHVPAHPQQSSTYSSIKQGIKPQIPISIRNDGVPADSQQTTNTPQLADLFKKKQETAVQQPHSQLSSRDIKNLVQGLTSDLKAKFKSLSKQELYIFSLIYNMNLRGENTDYKSLSIKAGLTESSIRDYISRLIHKGVPIEKERINNKTVLISVSDEFKNIATLNNFNKLGLK